MTTNQTCSKCTGEPAKPWAIHFCEEHDRCIGCNVKRVDLPETPWARINGIQCKPCRVLEIEEQIKTFQIRLEVEGDSILESTDEPTCPHCGFEQVDAWDYGDNMTEMDCQCCENTIKVEKEIEVSYSTRKKDE